MVQSIDNSPTRRYNINVQLYAESQTIARMEGCFAYMFTNVGDTIATVNGMVINPSTTPATSLGDSRTISGHTCDLYVGNIDLSFDTTGAGTDPQVEIVQFFYI